MKLCLPAIPGKRDDPTCAYSTNLGVGVRRDVFSDRHARPTSARAEEVTASAVASSRSAWRRVGVLRRVCVALRTVCLFTLPPRPSDGGVGRMADPATQILAPRHWLQMGWIDAGPVAAEVVEIQALRDGTYEQFVGVAVSHHAAVAGWGEASVAVGADRRPRPALISSEWPARPLNECPEALLRRPLSVWPPRTALGHSRRINVTSDVGA